MKQFHAEKNASDDIVTEDVRPTMVPISSNNLSVEEPPHVETSSDLNFQEIYNDDVVSSNNAENLEVIEQNHNESNTEELITKRSRLENVISKTTKNIDHSFTLNQCVIEKLKHYIKNNNFATVYYTRSCFDEMLDGKGLINWLSLTVGLKPNRLKKILSENLPNKRNSLKLPPSSHQDIYDLKVHNIDRLQE